ncbi:MAG: hypothetical protein JWP57_3948, partial [Spirosoma sp.]|nr:hypothetical protein [Spirosoma sp.]
VQPNGNAYYNNSKQGQQFSRCKNVLNQFTALNTPAVQPCQQYQAANRIKRPQRNLHGADREQDVLWSKGRNKNGRKFSESHRYGRNNTRLNDGEDCPAVNKASQLAIGPLDVYVLTPCFRHHAGQFAIAECGCHCHYARKHPQHKQPSRGAQVSGHIGRDDEDARPNHGAGDDKRRVEKAKGAVEFGLFVGDCLHGTKRIKVIYLTRSTRLAEIANIPFPPDRYKLSLVHLIHSQLVSFARIALVRKNNTLVPSLLTVLIALAVERIGNRMGHRS